MSDQLLPDLVAAHARHRPGAIAVRQGETTLTYEQLSTSADALAAELRRRGAGPETLVGVCTPRRPDLIVAIIAVLRAGAGYVPLDPALPEARRRLIAQEAGLPLIVGEGLPIGGWPATEPIACPATLDNVAYVMFTSGSTGRPKGVVIEHRALSDFVTSMAAMSDMDTASRCLAFASIGFDASVIDILTPLAAGATVVLATEAERADNRRLQRFCQDHEVNVGFFPPAILPLLEPADLPDLRVVLTGSEAPGPEQVQRWTADGRRFLNLYGPTEATVLVTWFEASGRWDRPLPIGHPAPGHGVRIVDEQMAEADEGELLASGPGLARGYLGDAALTAEKFVSFAGERHYRTGDLVRRESDGSLVYLGRADRQVKVRGQRIELGEVEAVLRSHPGVRHATVTVQSGLTAYVTGEVTPVEVRQHCAGLLPEAMVPARVHVVAELPLLSSGKVDLAALVQQTAARGSGRPAVGALAGVGGGAPSDAGAVLADVPGGTGLDEVADRRLSDVEAGVAGVVARCWASVLDVLPVRGEDDFFDCGGHSIAAMRLVAALRVESGRDVSIEDVLLGRTWRGIAERVQAAERLPETPPRWGRPPELSPAQQRLWFLDRYSPEGAAAYNVGLAERLRGPLNVSALERALTAVAARQEVLRWRIVEADGVPAAVQDPPALVALPIVDATPDQVPGLLGQWARHRFDLAGEALWQARLIRLGEDDHVLSLTLHHAVFDGWSQALLYADLAAAYRGEELPGLPATYADYVAYRQERRDTRRGDLDWWLDHLDGAPVLLELETDKPRPAEQTFSPGQAELTLSSEVAQRLSEGGNPAAAVLAAFAVVLGQSDVVIGTPVVDRRLAEFQDMVGFFIEIAPLRLQVNPDAGFASHVRAARDELLAALAHPEAPLERIVGALGLGGQVQRTPLVQVLFNMFNFAEPRLELADVDSETVPVPMPGSPFDMTLYGVQRDGRTRLEILYNADVFAHERILGMLQAIERVIATGEMPPTVAEPAGRRATRQPVAAGITPPATPTERMVASVWSDVLGTTEVSVTESFFHAGGGSIAVAAMQQRLARLTGRELRVVDLFRHATVRSLASYLDGAEDDLDDQLARAAQRGAARRQRGRAR